MKRPVNHPYNKFQLALRSSEIDTEKRWGGLTFKNMEVAINLFSSMSSRSKGKVVSDSRWNHYPLFSYTSSSKRRFGHIISRVVDCALEDQSKETLRVLENKAVGVFAVHLMDSATSKTRLKMAKRLQNSPDQRVRTRCARILPTKYLHKMLDDKSYSVRSMALTRIGMDNCYERFLPESLGSLDKSSLTSYWYHRWLSREAIRLSTKDQVLPLINDAKKISAKDARDLEPLLYQIIKKLTPEESLYFMNLGEDSLYIKNALEDKLGFSK